MNFPVRVMFANCVRRQGKGQTRWSRVIYCWYSDEAPINALLAYGKNEKTELKPEEAKAVAAFAKAIKAGNRSKI